MLRSLFANHPDLDNASTDDMSQLRHFTLYLRAVKGVQHRGGNMLELVHKTGHPEIDGLLAAIVSLYDVAFPGRVRGYYLVGSYGTADAIRRSDIDMTLVFTGAISLNDSARLLLMRQAIREMAFLHVDINTIAEATFGESDTCALVMASQFLYGEDTRRRIPLPSAEVYLRNISMPTQRGLTHRFRHEEVTLPLAYPDADDEFFGYIPDKWKGVHGDIKMWVLHVGWLATFLIIYSQQSYIPSKQHMLNICQQHPDEDWMQFVLEVFYYGREQWGYDMPPDGAGRRMLRDLCARTLAFENFVAAHYLNYLEDEQTHGNTDMAEDRLNAFARA